MWQVERFLSGFAECLDTSPPLSAEDVAGTVLQLRHVQMGSEASLRLLDSLATLLARGGPEGGAEFSSRQAGLALFGLSELPNETQEARRVLGAIHARAAQGEVRVVRAILFALSLTLSPQVRMLGDDLCLAVYGLKSCTHAHEELDLLLEFLQRQTHAVFAKPLQPWEDYERLLPATHAGMLGAVRRGASSPSFSMHSIATALEGVRGLSQSLSSAAGAGAEEGGPSREARTLQRVQALQATLLTKIQYTDAPLNLTHLSLFLNALRFNPSEYYIDPSRPHPTNLLKMLAYKCVTKLYVTPSRDYQSQVGFVLHHLRRMKAERPWNKVILLNSVFPQLEAAEEPLDSLNSLHVLHLLVNSHLHTATCSALAHLAAHLRWNLALRRKQGQEQQQQQQQCGEWSEERGAEMAWLVSRVRRARPNPVLGEVEMLIAQLTSPPPALTTET